MADNTDSAMASALAGAAISEALLEALFDKEILSLDESRAILDRAMKSLTPVMLTVPGMAAAGIIGVLQRGKFFRTTLGRPLCCHRHPLFRRRNYRRNGRSLIFGKRLSPLLGKLFWKPFFSWPWRS